MNESNINLEMARRHCADIFAELKNVIRVAERIGGKDGADIYESCRRLIEIGRLLAPCLGCYPVKEKTNP